MRFNGFFLVVEYFSLARAMHISTNRCVYQKYKHTHMHTRRARTSKLTAYIFCLRHNRIACILQFQFARRHEINSKTHTDVVVLAEYEYACCCHGRCRSLSYFGRIYSPNQHHSMSFYCHSNKLSHSVYFPLGIRENITWQKVNVPYRQNGTLCDIR